MPHESGFLEQIASGGLPLPGLTDDAPDVAVDVLSLAKSAAPRKFRFFSAGEMFTSYAPAQWLIDGFIQENSLVMAFGESTAGKSFLLIDWACSIAVGRSWNGAEVVQGPVFIVAGEGFGGFVRRLRAWEIMNGESVGRAPLYFSERPAALMNAESAKEVIEAVRELSAAHGRPALIVVDTLHRNFGPGDENSAADFGQFLSHIDVMRLELKAAIVVVHHSGHSKADRSRGSSSIRAAMDHEYYLSIEADKSRRLSCTKMKDGPTPEPITFALRGVELDLLDAKGRPDTSATLVRLGDQGNQQATPERGNKALEYIRKAVEVCGCNQKEIVRTAFYSLYPSDDKDAKRKAFNRGWGQYFDSLVGEP